MLFNSITFLIFFIVFLFLYWYPKYRKINHQNILILFASYIFYGWWDWRFLSLIFISSLVDYFSGLGIYKAKNIAKRKLWLGLSLAVNLGFLIFFKYFNFFIESFIQTFSFLGFYIHPTTLKIILPVGISFYTFQTLSYSIDIYKNKLNPTKDPIAFFAFVSFFPQLVAGPIERAKNLIPQFDKKRIFNPVSARLALRLILFGLFKKVVIADNCGIYVDQIFGSYQETAPSELALGVFYFAFQIYGDFSGYSDMAIGFAKLLGFDLMTNFRLPYFSKSVAEFWQRWHISLSTWFRDYVYIPLGGSRVSKSRRVINIMITFLVSGLWHGANWTFVVWGGLNGLFYLPSLYFKEKQTNLNKNQIIHLISRTSKTVITFIAILITWIFFRAENMQMAFRYLSSMFQPDLLRLPNQFRGGIFWILLLLFIEGINRNRLYALDFSYLKKPVRWAIYYGLILIIIFFGNFQMREFIYFQF